MLEAERQAEQQRLQQMKSEMLETELQNKNNELTPNNSFGKKKRGNPLCWKNWINRKRHWVTDIPQVIYPFTFLDRIYLERSSGLGAVRDLF